MNRKREQAELFFQLGQLLGPMLKMAENPDSYDTEERTRIIARYCSDENQFRKALQRFTQGEPGHNYMPQFHHIQVAMGNFWTHATSGDFQRVCADIVRLRDLMTDTLHSIPIPVESSIHEARTPFSTYCLVKDLCTTVQSEITWLDRYFDHTIFYRYLADVPNGMSITLVTYPDTKCQSARDRQRCSDFLDMSRLFAQERGPQAYRLITDEHFHDRWLRCDDKLFSLGGSIKDLGKDSTFTITKLDSTPENMKLLVEPLARGVEVFGPNQPNHP